MKNTLIIVVLVAVISCSPKGDNRTGAVDLNEGAISTQIPLSYLQQANDTLINKEVEVEGMVTHVCKHSGKRLHLEDKQSGSVVRVEAGDIDMFEKSLEGSQVIVKGVLKRGAFHEEGEAQEHDGQEGVYIECKSIEEKKSI